MNKEKNSLHRGHRERMRQRLLKYGADSFCSHELIEYLLYYVIPRRNTNEIAHELINKFKTLNGVFEASQEEIADVKGMGNSSAMFLKLIADLYSDNDDTPVAMSESEICQYFLDYFKNSSSDLCLLLNIVGNYEIRNKITFTKSKIINDENEQRRILELLLKAGCNKLILGINHSENTFLPDKDDLAITRMFAEKYTCIDIHLIDSIACFKNNTVSLKKCGIFSF